MKADKPFSFGKYAIVVFCTLLLSAPTVSAADKVRTILENASQWFLNVIVSIGVLMVLLGAFYFTTSGGDTQKVEKGQKAILWGMVGVVIALLAKAIVTWTTQIAR